jgi:3-dehydroquinate synthetase
LRVRGGEYVVLSDARPDVVAIARRIARDRPLLTFALGERRKRLATVERVLDALAMHGVERATTIVGVGGGVASDLFGLAAALYMRGVPYVHVATSLVAMADAAVGGKTGVDLRAAKNLAGSFRDPNAVFAHLDALRTLPLRSLREGLAEVVKVAIIAGGDLFETLEMLAPHPFAKWPWAAVVASAVGIKREIVSRDREESGERELLNLGHTFGHAFERASSYRITHGAGVALGLRAAGLLALRLGRFSEREHLRVLTLLALLKMPLRTSVAPGDALAAMMHDKKRRKGQLRFVLPRAIGDVQYGIEAPRRAVVQTLSLMRRTPGEEG